MKKHRLKDELLAMAEEDQRVLQELIDGDELGTIEYLPSPTGRILVPIGPPSADIFLLTNGLGY